MYLAYKASQLEKLPNQEVPFNTRKAIDQPQILMKEIEEQSSHEKEYHSGDKKATHTSHQTQRSLKEFATPGSDQKDSPEVDFEVNRSAYRRYTYQQRDKHCSSNMVEEKPEANVTQFYTKPKRAMNSKGSQIPKKKLETDDSSSVNFKSTKSENYNNKKDQKVSRIQQLINGNKSI